MSIEIILGDTDNGVTIESGRGATNNDVSVLSAALAAESASRASADAALSLRINSAGVASVTSQEVSAAIALEVSNRTSADNVLSIAIAAVSNSLSAEGVTRSTNDAALSVRINTVSNAISGVLAGGGVSVTSQELSAAAAGLSTRIDSAATQHTSANNAQSVRIDTVSNTVSINYANTLTRDAGEFAALSLKPALSDGDRFIIEDTDNGFAKKEVAFSTIVQNATSVISIAHAATEAAVRAVSVAVTSVNNRVSGISSDVTSIGSRVDTVSSLVSTVASALSTRIDAVSQAVSAKTISSLIGVSIAGATDQQVLTYNSADGKWHASTIVAGSGSVTSTELSAVSAAAQSAINTVSVAQAATSAAVTSVNDRVSAISSNVTSIAGRLDTVSALVSTAVSALSQAISAKTISSLIGVSIAGATDGQVLMYNSADGKYHASTVAVGTGSVTSTELSAVSAAAASAAATLSTRVDSVQSSLSTTQSSLSALSADVTSIKDRVSANSSLISTVASALSARIDVASNATSIVSSYVNKAIGSEFAGGNISVGSVVINWANGRNQAFSIQGSVAIAAPTNGSAGASYVLRFQQDGTGSRQATWNSAFVFEGGTPPVFGSVSAVDLVGLYFDGTTYYGTGAAAAGTGSVTSTELSAVSAAAASADATLSVRINSVQSSLSTTQSSLSALSADVTSAKDRLSALSSQVTSADNAISNAVSIVSVAQAATSAAVTSVNNRVSAISADVTSVQNRISANSAQMISADNAISNAVSIVSAYVVKTVAKEYAGGNISTGSVVVDWANGNAQAFSILSAAAMAVPTNASAGVTYLLRFQQDGTGSKQLTWNSAFKWQGSITPTLGGASAVDIVGLYYDGTNYYGRHDTLSVTVQGGSVTSTELSAVSAAAAANLSVTASALSTRIDTVSNAVSAGDAGLSTRIDTVSNQVSVISAGLGGVQMRVVGGQQSISTSVLANVSGLSISIAANGVYQIEARIMYNVSAISATGFRFEAIASGFTQERVVGAWFGTSAMTASAGGAAVAMVNQPFNGLSGAKFSVVSAGTIAANYVDMEAMVAASTTGGTFQIQAIVNVGTNSMYIHRGSFIRAFKIL